MPSAHPLASTPVAPRPPARRDGLIDELIDVFLRQGFLALGIDGFARELHCSKSTLYAVASSKQEIIETVIRAFFRRATARVEARMRDAEQPHLIGTYLTAIADELAAASPAFFADLDEYEPAQRVYRDNTRIAARRVQELVLSTMPETSRADAVFVGVVAGQVMDAINRGDIKASTGLGDASAYGALARLIEAGTGYPTTPPTTPRTTNQEHA